MKRILIIGLSGQMGGTENYIYNLIKQIDLDKYVFDFLVVQDGHRTPYEEEINTLFADSNNHFHYCPNLKKNYCNGRKWLKEFYDKHAYDLIYMNATTAARASYCRYAINRLHVPLITHSHRSDGNKLNHILYKAYTFKHSAYKLACSRNAADWMYGEKYKEAIIIPNGIDTKRFSFSLVDRKKVRNQLGYSETDIILGHVGRFSEEKNHRFLVELCNKLDVNYKFLCIGDGPLKAEIEHSIDIQGLNDRFTLLPVRKDVNLFYSAMDGFLMPSYNEGLPIVSVEAQCSGLACIFSDTISKETNISKQCHYVKLNNVADWVRTIISMEYKRYDGASAVKRSGYDMRDTAKQIEILFERAIAGR